jgi:alpha-glucosidase
MALLAILSAMLLAATTNGLAEDRSAQPVYKRTATADRKESEPNGPDQSAPIEELRVEPIADELRQTYRLDPFYKKAVVLDGIAIVGSENVSDYAFLECAWIVDHMLAGQDRIKRALVDNKVRIGIIAATEYTMDIPENQRPRMMARAAFHDRRSRGLGGMRLATCGEENLLSLRGDPYAPENITIHEFAHTIASNLRRVDRAWWNKLEELYRQAMDDGLWKDTYAATNVQEYWAEGTQSWFDCNTPRDDGRVHNGVWNREKLQRHDPRLAEFLKETFGDRPWRYTKTTNRPAEQRTHLDGLDRDKMPRFSFENSPRIKVQNKQTDSQ